MVPYTSHTSSATNIHAMTGSGIKNYISLNDAGPCIMQLPKLTPIKN